mmetsp:Transcript_29208/g.25829  ORF Transcript_29208/g.25829 Transcript_29208/m.25829 type:complete len:81 (+) Transcript_29208:971-1213(+)
MRYHRGWVETQESALRKQYIQCMNHNNSLVLDEENVFLPSPSDNRSSFKHKDMEVTDMKPFNTINMDELDPYLTQNLNTS